MSTAQILKPNKLVCHLLAIADGRTHHEEALRVALSLKCISSVPEHVRTIHRYLNGTQRSDDHIQLQKVAYDVKEYFGNLRKATQLYDSHL